LIKTPKELALLIKIAFHQSEETGDVAKDEINPDETELKNLIFWNLVSEENQRLFIINKKVVDITLMKRPEKTLTNNKLLSDKDFIFTSEKEKTYFEITLAFRDLFLNNLKEIGARTINIEQATFEKWVTPVRLMVESDGITLDDLRAVFKFLKGHHFWRDKVQSTEKLRIKFQTIHSQIKSNETRSGESGEKKYGGVSEDFIRNSIDKIQSNSNKT